MSTENRCLVSSQQKKEADQEGYFLMIQMLEVNVIVIGVSMNMT